MFTLPFRRPTLVLVLASIAALTLTGCGADESAGADDQDLEFTVDVLERANDLARQAQDGVKDPLAGSGSVRPYLLVGTGSQLTGSGEVILDLSAVQGYDAIRSPIGLQPAGDYVVRNEFVNIRTEPTVRSSVVGRLNRGDSLHLIAFANADWAEVQMKDGKKGYVSAEYIARIVPDDKLAAELTPYEGQYFVSYRFVNMRAEPRQDSAKIGQIPGREIVKPLRIADGWAHVQYGSLEGYVASSYLTAFRPPLIERQNTFVLPILHYRLSQEIATGSSLIASMQSHVQQLQKQGFRFITLRALHDTLVAQQDRDVRLGENSIVLAFTGVDTRTVSALSDALNAAEVDATIFLSPRSVGLAGITEKAINTLQANGFDIAVSLTDEGDMRGLTNTQASFIMKESRRVVEQVTGEQMIAVAYPQGGENERIMQLASQAGYLFGLSDRLGRTFTRAELLQLPSIPVTLGMSADDVERVAAGM